MIWRKMNTAVLLLSTPRRFARKGAVAAICQFLVAHDGRVLHCDDHLDNSRDLSLSRLEWDLDGFDIPISDFADRFKPLAEQFQSVIAADVQRDYRKLDTTENFVKGLTKDRTEEAGAVPDVAAQG